MKEIYRQRHRVFGPRRRLKLYLCWVIGPVLLTACSGAPAQAKAQSPKARMPDILACTALINVLNAMGDHRQVTEQQGQDVVLNGEKASDPMIRQIAAELVTSANNNDITATNQAMSNLAVECNKVGLFPGFG